MLSDDDAVTNLSAFSTINVKIQVTVDNKVFKSMSETILDNINVSKLDLDTNSLTSRLVFTKDMTQQEAYTQLRTKIQELSNGIYKNVDDIKADPTLTAQIWTPGDSSTSTMLSDDDAVTNLSAFSTINVKIQVTVDNKVFKSMDEITLSITLL